MEFSLIADGNAKSYRLWETIGQFLIKLNMDLLYDQKFSLVYLTQKMKSYVHIKNLYAANVCSISSLFILNWKQPKYS